ncbi:MAG: hypothetical protein OXN90_02790, partial [Gemmatimonadota bacterium]|nr:hypothetical protein [Gemmatimonadota bacterium]
MLAGFSGSTVHLAVRRHRDAAAPAAGGGQPAPPPVEEPPAPARGGPAEIEPAPPDQPQAEP